MTHIFAMNYALIQQPGKMKSQPLQISGKAVWSCKTWAQCLNPHSDATHIVNVTKKEKKSADTLGRNDNKSAAHANWNEVKRRAENISVALVWLPTFRVQGGIVFHRFTGTRHGPKPLKIMKPKTKPKPDSQKSRKPKPSPLQEAGNMGGKGFGFQDFLGVWLWLRLRFRDFQRLRLRDFQHTIWAFTPCDGWLLDYRKHFLDAVRSRLPLIDRTLLPQYGSLHLYFRVYSGLDHYNNF